MAFDVWLENRTPFAAATHVQADADGQEVLVVMLSASFEAQKDGGLAPAAEQVPVAFADVPFGDPARSSIRYEADIAPVKPAVEIVVNGTAHAPGGQAGAGGAGRAAGRADRQGADGDRRPGAGRRRLQRATAVPDACRSSGSGPMGARRPTARPTCATPSASAIAAPPRPTRWC